jgi:hypothetical protein
MLHLCFSKSIIFSIALLTGFTTCKKQSIPDPVSAVNMAFPYGLDWFIQQKEGIKLAWHYGNWVGCLH